MKLNKKSWTIAAASLLAAIGLCWLFVRSERPIETTSAISVAPPHLMEEREPEPIPSEIMLPPVTIKMTPRRYPNADPLQDKLNEFERMKSRSLHLLTETP